MAEAFLAGVIGFLVARGVPKEDALSIVKALETYLGYEPPLGLTGYSLMDISKGDKKNTCVVVRGKTYHAVALDNIIKHSTISVLGKRGAYLEVAPTIESFKLTKLIEKVNQIDLVVELTVLKLIEKIELIEKVSQIDLVKLLEVIETIYRIDQIFSIGSIENIVNGDFSTGDFSGWHPKTGITITGELQEFLNAPYGCKFDNADGYLTQYKIFNSNRVDGLAFWARKPTVGGADIMVRISYNDGTNTEQTFTLSLGWKAFVLAPVADKWIDSINFTDNDGICFLDAVRLLMNI